MKLRTFLSTTLALAAVAPTAAAAEQIHVVNDTRISLQTIMRWERATEWEAGQLALYWNTPAISFVNDPPLPPVDDTSVPAITVPTLWLEASHYLTSLGRHDSTYAYCDDDGECQPLSPAAANNPRLRLVHVPYMVVVPDSGNATNPTSVTFSHEVMETLVDPIGYTRTASGRPIEVCDHAYSTVTYYGVRLTGFDMPRFFGVGTSGPYVWPTRDLTIPQPPRPLWRRYFMPSVFSPASASATR